MKDEFLAKLDMYSAVKTYLLPPGNQPLWLNLSPTAFTALFTFFIALTEQERQSPGQSP